MMTFEELFGRPPAVTARAPGRVNLIGEHTDYNDGFVLPAPIPQVTEVQIARTAEADADAGAGADGGNRANRGNDGDGGDGGARIVRAWSGNLPERGIASYRLGEERRQHDWLDYVAGITKALREAPEWLWPPDRDQGRAAIERAPSPPAPSPKGEGENAGPLPERLSPDRGQGRAAIERVPSPPAPCPEGEGENAGPLRARLWPPDRGQGHAAVERAPSPPAPSPKGEGEKSARARPGAFDIGGFDLLVTSDVPLGSGLSSSASLEIALLRGLRELFALPLSDVDLARIGQRAENDLVGAPVGIMDQMAASLCQAGEALFLDTADLSFEPVPLPASVDLVVIDSLVRHSHASSEYRTRREECERACAALGVASLRALDPVSPALLDRLAALPEPLGRRARHVVTENGRVRQMVEALRKERLEECGRLLYEGHASMRDDYAITVPAIDLLVEIARAQPGVLGARMTGGGFGGSIVVLARAGAGRQAADAIVSTYRRQSGKDAMVLVPR
jgi:galactokinase